MDYNNIVIEGSDILDDYHKFRSIIRLHAFKMYDKESIRIVTQLNGYGTPQYARKFATNYKLPLIKVKPNYNLDGPLALRRLFEHEASIGDFLITIISNTDSKYTYLINAFNIRLKPILIYNFINCTLHRLNY